MEKSHHCWRERTYSIHESYKTGLTTLFSISGYLVLAEITFLRQTDLEISGLQLSSSHPGVIGKACLFRSGPKNSRTSKNNIRREAKRLKMDMAKRAIDNMLTRVQNLLCTTSMVFLVKGLGSPGRSNQFLLRHLASSIFIMWSTWSSSCVRQLLF